MTALTPKQLVEIQRAWAQPARPMLMIVLPICDVPDLAEAWNRPAPAPIDVPLALTMLRIIADAEWLVEPGTWNITQ